MKVNKNKDWYENHKHEMIESIKKTTVQSDDARRIKEIINDISNTITDLAFSGASRDEIYEAVQCSANIIDAKKNHDILRLNTLYNEFKSKFNKENKNDRITDT